MKYLLIILLIWPINLIAQVNIEQYRNNTGSLSKKYFQHVNISTSVKRSTSNLYSIGLKYFKPFALPHSKGFLLTKVNYGESNGKEYVNNTFYHLRVISSTLVMNVIPEAFIQFENNHYALTKERYLAGIGLRYKYANTINGTSIVNEWYKETGSISRYNQWRLSQYVKFDIKFNDSNKLSSTLYIQPSVTDLTNIRYYAENSYNSQLTNTISYNSTLSAKFFSKSENFHDVELFFESGLQFKI